MTGVGEVLAAQAAVAARARQRRTAALHRVGARRDPRRPARRARREPARRADALPGGEGAGGALEGRDHALPDDVQALAPAVLPTGCCWRPRRPATTGRPSCATPSSGCRRCEPRPLEHAQRDAGGRGSRPRRGADAGGAALRLAVAAGCPAVALAALAARAAAVGGARGARRAGSRRIPGPHTVEEEQPYPLRLELLPGLVPPPGGELREPLLDEPMSLGAGGPGRVRIDVRFSRRGRRVLEPGRAHDPRPAAAGRARAVRARASRPSCSCFRASSRVLARPRRARAAAGAGPDGGRRARRRCAGAWTARPPSWTSTGCAPTAQGTPAVADPLARGGAQRRDARAPADRRRGLGSAGGARRLRAALGGGARHGGAGGGLAVRAPGAPRRVRAAAARRSPARCSWRRTWPRGRPLHARLAVVAAGARPPAAGARAPRGRGDLGERPRRRARATSCAPPAAGGWLVSPARPAAPARRWRSRWPAAAAGGWAAPAVGARPGAAA